MNPTAPPQGEASNAALASRIWRDYLARRWKALWPAVACAVIAGVANGVLLGLVAQSVDKLLKTHGAHNAWLIVPAELGLAGLVRGLAMIGQSLLINRIGHGVVADIQRQLVGNFMRGDLARLRGKADVEILDLEQREHERFRLLHSKTD